MECIVLDTLVGIEKTSEQTRARGVFKFPQGLGLYLTDALARHAKVLTDLLEGVVSALVDPEPEPKDSLLPRSQGGEHLPRLGPKVARDDRFGG